MTKNTRNENLLRLFMEGIIIVFLVLMIGIFPFYYQNYYLDIVYSKKSFFQTCSIALVLLGIVFAIPASIWNKKGYKIKISMTDLFAVLFFVTVCLSCYFSPAGKEAFWGNEGRRLGGAFLLLCIMVYFFVSRFYISSQILLWVFLLANYGVFLIIIINFWGIDLLNMYKNLSSSQHTIFIGTLGNVNINAGYCGIITTIMAVYYYLAEEKLSNRCFFIAVVMGIYACLATRSDSWLLAVGGGYLVILGFSMKDKQGLQKWCNLFGALIFGSVLIKLTEIISDLFQNNNIWIQDLQKHSLQYSLISWKVLFLELICLIAMLLIIKSPFVKFLNKYGNRILVSVLLIFIATMLIKILPLKDSFGTHRGYIWKRTVLNFKSMPILFQLIGYGPNSFLASMEENFGAEMRALYGTPYIDAHNEFLQFLAVTGILGVVSYMGMQISLIVSCVLHRKRQVIAVIGVAGIVSHMMQGIVNNPQVFTTPLLFVFLGILESKMREVRHVHRT